MRHRGHTGYSRQISMLAVRSASHLLFYQRFLQALGGILHKCIPHYIPSSMPPVWLSSHLLFRDFIHSSSNHLVFLCTHLTNIYWASHYSLISWLFLECPSLARMGVGLGDVYNRLCTQEHFPHAEPLTKCHALSKSFPLHAKCSQLCISNSGCFPELSDFNMSARFGLIRNVPLTAALQHGQNWTHAPLL